MSITTPVIIVFKEYMDAGYMPSFINGGNMTFKSLQAAPSTSWNALATYNTLEIGQGYISYNNEYVYTDEWSGTLRARAIYVTDWGTFDSDALLDWIENGDPQYAPEIWPVNIEGIRVKFSNPIVPQKTYGYIGFSSNGHTFDYMDCYSSDGYDWKVRYDLGDDYRVIPAAGYADEELNWSLSGYRVVSFKEWESSADDTTKVPFTLWIAVNSSRISSLPSYKLGWKPKPAVPTYPVKSDIILLNLDGNGAKRYLVLKNVSETTYEILWMPNSNADNFGTAVFASSGNRYNGSGVDNALNGTFYNTLTQTAKSAIVDKTFNSGYYRNATESLTRHIYAIEPSDISSYLGTTPNGLTTKNMLWGNYTPWDNKMWTRAGNQTVSGMAYMILWSNSSSDSYYSDRYGATTTAAIRPAMQIDLSKISFTIEE